MKAVFVFALVAVLMIFASCSNNVSPKEAARGYLSSLQKKDWGSACDFVEESSQEAIEKAAMMPCDQYLQKNQTDQENNNNPLYVKQIGSWGIAKTDQGDLYLRRTNNSWKISWLPPEWLLERAP